MVFKYLIALLLLLVSFIGLKVFGQVRVQRSEYSSPEKLLVISDIEGEFDGVRKFLLANQVIDNRNNWRLGSGHLVICGDLLDRGGQIFELLGFLKKLEADAKVSGGMVHIILGNHDIMNFSGNYKYLHKRYLDDKGKVSQAYLDSIKTGSEFGDWLRSKSVMEKVGTMLFLHGGISRELLDRHWPVEQVNLLCRMHYDMPKSFLPDSVKLLFGPSGPFWDRGYFMPPRVSQEFVDSTLKFYGVSRIIAGHTIVTRNIASYFDGKVIGVDVDGHAGPFSGLLIDGKRTFIVDDTGKRRVLRYDAGNEMISENDIL